MVVGWHVTQALHEVVGEDVDCKCKEMCRICGWSLPSRHPPLVILHLYFWWALSSVILETWTPPVVALPRGTQPAKSFPIVIRLLGLRYGSSPCAKSLSSAFSARDVAFLRSLWSSNPELPPPEVAPQTPPEHLPQSSPPWTKSTPM